MSNNASLATARKRKKDEFYTLYDFIEREINIYLEYDKKHGTETFRGKTVLCPCDDPEWSNFTLFFARNFQFLGLKKLISTSFSIKSKNEYYGEDFKPSDYDKSFPQYDAQKSFTRGKIFTLTKDIDKSGTIGFEDLEWSYLNGDGDFRSEEVTCLRDEADVIVTNPPFSLMTEFMPWLIKGNKKFLIVGSENAISYKEIFPLFKDNRVWLGGTCNDGDMVFAVPPGTPVKESDKKKAEKLGYVGDYTRQGNARWFTNLKLGRIEEPLVLRTMEKNLRFDTALKNKLRNKYNTDKYPKYDFYDAIEVPFVRAIPSDYDGAMGVPITILEKFCPAQFEILDANDYRVSDKVPKKKHGLIKDKDSAINGKPTYVRMLIRRRKDNQE